MFLYLTISFPGNNLSVEIQKKRGTFRFPSLVYFCKICLSYFPVSFDEVSYFIEWVVCIKDSSILDHADMMGECYDISSTIWNVDFEFVSICHPFEFESFHQFCKSAVIDSTCRCAFGLLSFLNFFECLVAV